MKPVEDFGCSTVYENTRRVVHTADCPLHPESRNLERRGKVVCAAALSLEQPMLPVDKDGNFIKRTHVK